MILKLFEFRVNTVKDVELYLEKINIKWRNVYVFGINLINVSIFDANSSTFKKIIEGFRGYSKFKSF